MYIPCIGNSSYSFWRILLKLYNCFQDGLKICILFSQDPEIIFFLHFNLDIFSSLYATDMYREYMPCIGNPAYSFRPILLKLYRYFAAFLWFHMRNLSLAGYNCSGGASCMACSFIYYCRRVDKNPYRHDGRTDKDSYRHDRRADSHCLHGILTGSAVLTHDVTTGTGYCLIGFNWIIDFFNKPIRHSVT